MADLTAPSQAFVDALAWGALAVCAASPEEKQESVPMNFSQQQADPRRHFAGISFVFLFHAFIVYALVTGLAKKVVEVVRAPIETKVIEEIKKPPLQPTISATTPTPPAVTNITPVAPAAAPTLAAAPAPLSASVVCSNFSAVMGDAAFPKEAMRQGLEKGDALIQFTLSAGGEIKDVKTVRASHPIFARNSIRVVGEYKCQGQGRDVLVQVPFGYKLE